ncbi:MAG: hypothetical protein R3C03_23760 [Pirellulaceae bacterium]
MDRAAIEPMANEKSSNAAVLFWPILIANVVYWTLYLLFIVFPPSSMREIHLVELAFAFFSMAGATVAGFLYGIAVGVFMRRNKYKSWTYHPLLMGLFEAGYFSLIVACGCVFFIPVGNVIFELFDTSRVMHK